MAEIYTSLNSMNPSAALEFYEKKCVKHDLGETTFQTYNTKTTEESISFRGIFLCNTLMIEQNKDRILPTTKINKKLGK